MPGDLEIVAKLRASDTAILAVINKIDVRKAREAALQFYELGFDPLFEISAEHGTGVGDLLDGIVRRLKKSGQAARDTRPVRPTSTATDDDGDAPTEDVRAATPRRETAVAIVGRPNAGKSSLVNRLLREERMIVSEMPGTTRDAVDTLMRWHKREFRIVDTAGIRRPGRVGRSGQVESLSVLVARRAIESADIVVLIVDATRAPPIRTRRSPARPTRRDAGHHRRQQVGPGEGAGPRLRQGIRRAAPASIEVPRLRPHPPYFGITGERAPKLLEAIDRVTDVAKKARQDPRS